MAIKKNEAPLASINEKTITYQLTLNELNNLKTACDVMKDFLKTPLLNLRKLHKNSKIIQGVIDKFDDESELINTRIGKINQELSKTPNDEKLLTERTEMLKEIKDYNRAKHSVNLYTMPASDFPAKPEDFGKKFLNKGQQNQVDVEYSTFFIELFGTVIPEEEL